MTAVLRAFAFTIPFLGLLASCGSPPEGPGLRITYQTTGDPHEVARVMQARLERLGMGPAARAEASCGEILVEIPRHPNWMAAIELVETPGYLAIFGADVDDDLMWRIASWADVDPRAASIGVRSGSEWRAVGTRQHVEPWLRARGACDDEPRTLSRYVEKLTEDPRFVVPEDQGFLFECQPDQPWPQPGWWRTHLVARDPIVDSATIEAVEVAGPANERWLDVTLDDEGERRMRTWIATNPDDRVIVTLDGEIVGTALASDDLDPTRIVVRPPGPLPGQPVMFERDLTILAVALGTAPLPAPITRVASVRQ